MDNVSFSKIVGILGLNYNELAEISGYSVESIRSMSSGRRKVSPRIEQFLFSMIVERKSDPAIQFVFNACLEQ